MAEMQVAEKGGKKGGKVRAKKMSTRIDFTPMVDLGFLLITFFMLTTTLNKPQVMPVVFPEKDVPQDNLEPVKESKVLTLMLGGKDKVYYYAGITDAKLDSTDFSAEGLRKVLLDKKAEVEQKFGVEKLTNAAGQEKEYSPINVIIKPTKDSRYKNVVDAFDEMHICKIDHYVMIDVSKAEEDFIKNPAAGLKFSAEQQAEASTK